MTTVDKDGFVAKDYAFAGKTVDTKNKVFILIYPINEDGTLGERMAFEYKKKRDKMCGGVYTGASFNESGTIRGLDESRFKKQWHNQADRIKWQTSNDECEVDLRAARMEKETGRISEIEQLLTPLRKQYESYRFRHDFAGMEAMERAVLRALRSAPRVIE